MKKGIITIFLTLTLFGCNSKSNNDLEIQSAVMLTSYQYSILEGYKLLNQIEDPEARRVISCSIKNNVIAYKAYVDLDLPRKELKKKDVEYADNSAIKSWIQAN